MNLLVYCTSGPGGAAAAPPAGGAFKETPITQVAPICSIALTHRPDQWERRGARGGFYKCIISDAQLVLGSQAGGRPAPTGQESQSAAFDSKWSFRGTLSSAQLQTTM